jgi:hypothetical protein
MFFNNSIYFKCKPRVEKVDGLFSSKELYAVDNLYLVYGLRNDRIF